MPGAIHQAPARFANRSAWAVAITGDKTVAGQKGPWSKTARRQCTVTAGADSAPEPPE